MLSINFKKALIFTFVSMFFLNGAHLALASNLSKKKDVSITNKVTFSPIIKKVSPAVVSIYASNANYDSTSSLKNKDVYNHIFGRNQDDSYSIGSGVLISKDGLIVTNAHVIDNYSYIIIVTKNGKEYKAKVISINDSIDLALLKIEGAKDFNYLNLYDEDSSDVGDVVLAIGNPFGIGQTVTLGIISGYRYFENHKEIGFGKLIQVDAEINPGNSGGALIDSTGKLIGINSAIYFYNKKSYAHIAFAIPTSVVKLFVSRSLAGSNLKKYWIGVTGATVNGDMAKKLKLDYPSGVYVEKIYKGGPADLAKIHKGDVIVSINDTPINTISDLAFLVAKINNKEIITVKLVRNGKKITVDLTPDIPKETPPKNPVTIKKGVLSGATFVNNSPAVSYEINTDSMTKGVVLYKLKNKSLLFKLGIRVGDFVTSIGDTDIENTQQLKEYISSHPHNKYSLTLKRRNQIINLNINGNSL